LPNDRSEGIEMVDEMDRPEDDAEGHKKAIADEESNVEGHMIRKLDTEDTDVEGQMKARHTVDGDGDDAEGHVRKN
jgi:hypothetical protein